MSSPVSAGLLAAMAAVAIGSSASAPEPPRTYAAGEDLELRVEVVFPPGPHRVRGLQPMRSPKGSTGHFPWVMVAVGDDGLFLRPTWLGMFRREDVGTERGLFAAAGPRLFGERGLVLRRTGGSLGPAPWSWSEEPVGADENIYAAVQDGVFTVAVGERGLVLFHAHEGTEWQRISTGVKDDLRSIARVSDGERTVYFAAGDRGRILRCARVYERDATLRCRPEASSTRAPIHALIGYQGRLWGFGPGGERVAARWPRPLVFEAARMEPAAPWLSLHDFGSSSRPFVRTSTDGVVWIDGRPGLHPVPVASEGFIAASDDGRRLHVVRGDGALLEIERIDGQGRRRSRAAALLERAEGCERSDLPFVMPAPLVMEAAMRAPEPKIAGEWVRHHVECSNAACDDAGCCNRCRWRWGMKVLTQAGPEVVDVPFVSARPPSAAKCALGPLPASMKGRFLFSGRVYESHPPAHTHFALSLLDLCRIEDGAGRRSPALEVPGRAPLAPGSPASP